MKSFIRAGILLCCASLLPLAAVASAKTAPQFVAESARSVAGGHSVEVIVSQPEIASDIKASNISTATGGGLLPALIDASIEAKRTKKAEAAIAPIRVSMAGFDGDGLAQSTTVQALSHVEWMKDSPIKFSKDSTTSGKSQFLDAGDAGQGAFFEYSYQFSPDFSSIRVVVDIQFANKAQKEGNKPEARLKPKNLAYAQSVTSVIQLPDAGTDLEANAARWAADDSKLVKAALPLAFANAEKLLTRTLTLNETDIAALNDPSKGQLTVDGAIGIADEKTEGHIILWTAHGFMQADKLAAAQ